MKPLIEKCKDLYCKHKSLILYIFFGIITTAVNYVSYYIFKFVFTAFTDISADVIVAISNTIAWILAVLIAFITNKLFVFESRSLEKNIIIKEFIPFVAARILSFLFDIGIMIIGVNIWGINDLIVKTFSNIYVLIFNYAASRLFVFRKR